MIVNFSWYLHWLFYIYFKNKFSIEVLKKILKFYCYSAFKVLSLSLFITIIHIIIFKHIFDNYFLTCIFLLFIITIFFYFYQLQKRIVMNKLFLTPIY